MRLMGQLGPMGYEVAAVGTGEDPTERDRFGFAMAYRHAAAYQARSDCAIVACADIARPNAEAFADHHGLPEAAIFEDHERMLADAQPDIVSVCVPPAVHAEIVLDCARSGIPRAVHCEKPMAPDWRDCQAMVEACARENVQLTIDHQRRFAKPVRRAKALLDDGVIGELRRLEWSEVNLFDAGAHVFDLCDLFVDGRAPIWILAGVDTSEERRWFGALNSPQTIVHWEYEDGVQGIASTGDERPTAFDAYLRLVGTAGEMEIQPEDGPSLRLRTDGQWQAIDTEGEGLYGPRGSRLKGAVALAERMLPGRTTGGPERPNYGRAIDHLISCLEEGREPIISGATAIRGTELIFGAWESAHRRARVELPLEDVDTPLEDMFAMSERAFADH